MAKKSGGITARNTRQGFRSEYIAKYIFSAFGTAVDVSQENDIGIDILCNLTSFEGLLIIYKSSFGVQVKSEGSEFIYKGRQATTWLSKLEYPILLVSVDKKESKIKIYSGWNLNRFLLMLNSDNEASFPEQIVFITSDDDELKEPTKDGNIPVGKPILEFDFYDIENEDSWNRYHKILSEWLEIDNQNYLFRRSGVSCAFGYTKWETNKSLDESMRVWYKPYFYSPHHTNKIKKLLSEAIIPLGLYNKVGFNDGQAQNFKEAFNDLRAFANKYIKEEMDEFGKDLFKEDI